MAHHGFLTGMDDPRTNPKYRENRKKTLNDWLCRFRERIAHYLSLVVTGHSVQMVQEFGLHCRQ